MVVSNQEKNNHFNSLSFNTAHNYASRDGESIAMAHNVMEEIQRPAFSESDHDRALLVKGGDSEL